jgi:hypothetical protein
VKSYLQYCGACDRTVRVLLTETPIAEGQAPATDAELVCLEIGEGCTGGMCPLGAAEPGAMVRRIVHHGLPLDGLETVMAHCPSCDQDAEVILYGEGQAGCSVCGSLGRWVIDHLEPA